LDLHASPGISANSGFANLSGKHSESSQLDPIAACHGGDNRVENGVDNFVDVRPIEARVLDGYGLNEFGLEHSK
jgi:hypothetical protein